MTLLEIKKYLRGGQYAWPGGYPLFFITDDGAALSFDAVKKEWRQVVQDHLWSAKTPGFRGTGWLITACSVNYDKEIVCDHTGKPIECAYE